MSIELKTQLKDFQEKTVKWMKEREDKYDGGMLLHEPGLGKCHKIDTDILMFDGNIKKVQDITVGELLMGDDSTSRTVLTLARGQDFMYEIIPVKGESYTVNQEHILCLKISGNPRIQNITDKSKKSLQVIWFENIKWNRKNFNLDEREKAEEFFKNVNHEQILEIAVKNYIKLNKTIRNRLKGYKVPIEFCEKQLAFDPYIIGLWLGDKTSSSSNTNQDSTIYYYLKEQNLIDNKHIPMIYKCNSRENRLKLLAGLLDSNGNLLDDKCTFDFTQKSEKLIDDVIYLCRSLGFSCDKQKKEEDDYFRICISGYGTHEIPTLCPKKAKARKQIKDVLVTGIKVKEVGYDNYYGFEINKNRRYIMGDFTVTHNTVCMLSVICEAPLKTLIIVNSGLIDNWINEIQKHTNIPRLKVVKYYGSKRNDCIIDDKHLVYITSYSIIAKEFNNGEFDKTSLISKVQFGRIVLDEAHYIRNASSTVHKSVIFLGDLNVNIKKWIITATPIFNDPIDTFAYFKFLNLEGIDTKRDWSKVITKNKEGLRVLNNWMKKYGISYKKKDVLKELKDKEEKCIRLDFNNTEQDFYDALKNYSLERMKKLVKRIEKLNKSVFQDIDGSMRKILHTNVMVYILRLKQACDSPQLVLRSMKRLENINNIKEAVTHLKFYNDSKQQEQDEECPICYDKTADFIADPCGHKCCEGCWNKMFNAGVVNCPKCRTYVDKISSINKDEITEEEKEEDKNKKDEIDLAELRQTSKIKYITKLTKEVINKNEKIIIVSQWVGMLDIIRNVFDTDKHLKNIKYVNLQGNVTLNNRTKIISDFQNQTEVKVCFISLMASAEGINLTAANHLVLVDSWWNESKMIQVSDRIHRILQTKQVYIYKLQIKNSIEEKIEELVNKKSKMTKIVLSKWNDSKNQDDSWMKDMIKLLS